MTPKEMTDERIALVGQAFTAAREMGAYAPESCWAEFMLGLIDRILEEPEFSRSSLTATGIQGLLKQQVL